jgi:hypothetical protein
VVLGVEAGAKRDSKLAACAARKEGRFEASPCRIWKALIEIWKLSDQESRIWKLQIGIWKADLRKEAVPLLVPRTEFTKGNLGSL